MADEYMVRQMNRAEISYAIDLAAQEGWNPGISDASCFYSADPHGFFVGEWGGKPIGCISAVAYDDSFGFLGLYIVAPEFRGRGYGLRLWNVAMDYLAGRNIGLDGVVAQQENYKKSGFKLAYRNIRYMTTTLNCSQERPGNLVDLSSILFADLAEYDRKMFPANRLAFLKVWIEQPGAVSIGALNDLGNLAGYGVIRPCGEGYKIGPLFADDGQMAQDLFSALCESVSSGPIFLDIPEINQDAIALVEANRMEKVFETARMYSKSEPYLPIDRIFGVTTFELG